MLEKLIMESSDTPYVEHSLKNKENDIDWFLSNIIRLIYIIGFGISKDFRNKWNIMSFEKNANVVSVLKEKIEQSNLLHGTQQ